MAKPKIYKIPSKSEQGTKRIVKVYPNGTILCDCPAMTDECRHIKIYKRWKGEISGNPEKCFYSDNTTHLEEHHLYRASQRKTSLTVYLTHWIHERATWDKEFEKHLIYLFFNRDNMENFETTASIKEVSVKNLQSGDKGVRVEMRSVDLENALKLGQIGADQMVKIVDEDTEEKFYALVKSTKKTNYVNKDPEVQIQMEAAPAEVIQAYRFGMMEPEKEFKVEYKKVNKST